ncbi:MAG: serine aminopeptidase domain-containing protein, partial [Myxococcales bacterium]
GRRPHVTAPAPAAAPNALTPETLRFEATDGFALEGTLFPADGARGAVLIGSAMGVPRRLYAGLAAYFAEAGLTTLTFDYRGIAGSRTGPLRGFEARLVDWAERDLAVAFALLAARAPSVPPLYFGHSVGGQLLGFVPPRPLAGALFVASQSGHWRQWSGWRRPAMWGLWHLMIPSLVPAFGFLPMKRLGQGEDVPAGVARQWAEWGRSRDYLMVGVRERGARGFAEFAGPLRSDAIEDDGYAPPRSVEALLRLYTGAEAARELRLWRPGDVGADAIGHFGAFRPKFRDTLWSDWRGWLLART